MAYTILGCQYCHEWFNITLKQMNLQMKSKIGLIFLLVTLLNIHVKGESAQTFVESFSKCVDRIENYQNGTSYQEFCYSLDSIARYGLVDYSSMMNYSGPSGGLPDLHRQMPIWLQWCLVNKDTQTWKEAPSMLSKEGSPALYDQVICWIRDNLSKEQGYSEFTIDSLGNEYKINNIIYLKESKGITDRCGLIPGEKKFVTINTLFGDIENSIKTIQYYIISPALQDKDGKRYILVGDVAKDVVPIAEKGERVDPIDLDYGNFYDIYRIEFDTKDGSPSLSKWEKLGRRLSFRY